MKSKILVVGLLCALLMFGQTLINGYRDWSLITAPGNPAAGKVRMFANTATGRIECLNSSGTSCLVPSIRAIPCIFGDAATGSALTTAETCYLRVPFACTIVGYSITADAGTATVKTWRVATGGTAVPTVSNSISTSGVSLASGTAAYSATVTDWTSTAIAKDDWLAFNLSAVATAKQITFQIDCQQ